MKLKCFGIAKDIVHSSIIDIEAQNIATVADLKTYLNTQYPSFKQYAAYQIAVNQALANDHQKISAEDELAIIPPVSGG